MTKPSRDQQKCLWCRRPIEPTSTTGRKREYCRQSCRQRSYESRRHADEIGLSESDLIVARKELDALLDQVYVLQAAVEDVDRDLADNDDAAEVRRSLNWILSAARPLIATPLL